MPNELSSMNPRDMRRKIKSQEQALIAAKAEIERLKLDLHNTDYERNAETGNIEQTKDKGYVSMADLLSNVSVKEK